MVLLLAFIDVLGDWLEAVKFKPANRLLPPPTALEVAGSAAGDYEEVLGVWLLLPWIERPAKRLPLPPAAGFWDESDISCQI